MLYKGRLMHLLAVKAQSQGTVQDQLTGQATGKSSGAFKSQFRSTCNTYCLGRHVVPLNKELNQVLDLAAMLFRSCTQNIADTFGPSHIQQIKLVLTFCYSDDLHCNICHVQLQKENKRLGRASAKKKTTHIRYCASQHLTIHPESSTRSVLIGA